MMLCCRFCCINRPWHDSTIDLLDPIGEKKMGKKNDKILLQQPTYRRRL